MVLPPQAPDRVPSNITTPPPFITKAQSNSKYRSNFVNSMTNKTTRQQLSGSKQRLSPFQGNTSLQTVQTHTCCPPSTCTSPWSALWKRQRAG
ncbi:unnamed protein product [Coregonus sp. 'balchen']|nr:unnamed protein product [Coregonus sp. 'balchen']